MVHATFRPGHDVVHMQFFCWFRMAATLAAEPIPLQHLSSEVPSFHDIPEDLLFKGEVPVLHQLQGWCCLSEGRLWK